MWRGDDYMKDEGDPNYQSLRRDGTRYRGIRDYAEIGVDAHVRRWLPVRWSKRRSATTASSDHYEYSYRVLARSRERADQVARAVEDTVDFRT